MKTVTVDDILALNPCDCYDRKNIMELFAGRETLSLADICALDIPLEDRLWAGLKGPWLDDRQRRIFACDCAERALPIYEREHPYDKRPRQAIEVARRFAEGMATNEELAATWAATWDSARDVARDVAISAARAAAWAAAWAASWGDFVRWELDHLQEIAGRGEGEATLRHGGRNP